MIQARFVGLVFGLGGNKLRLRGFQRRHRRIQRSLRCIQVVTGHKVGLEEFLLPFKLPLLVKDIDLCFLDIGLDACDVGCIVIEGGFRGAHVRFLLLHLGLRKRWIQLG